MAGADDLRRVHKAFIDCDRSVRGAARLLGMSRHSTRKLLDEAKLTLGLDWQKPVVSGKVHGRPLIKRALPRNGSTALYIITSAQNNTHAHYAFWANLKAYAEYRGAELLVSQYTYNKASYGRKAVKPGGGPTWEDLDDLWYDDCFDGHYCNDRVELAPSLVFCGEVNILPTARRALTGFETYAGASSAIFPHSTIALQAIAEMDHVAAKHNYTTGTATQRNYIQKKDGLRAEHHHCYGALIVEVDANGSWWVRQLNATEEGSFFDLEYFVEDGKIEAGHEVEAINWGDVHVEQMDPTIRKVQWGAGGILDTLHPRYQLLHDTVDFRARNHHEMKDPFQLYKKWRLNGSSVEGEFARVRDFLNEEAHRDWCEAVVVDSNHDNALLRWLKDGDWKQDPENAEFYLRCALAQVRALDRCESSFHLVENVLQEMGVHPSIRFLRTDESFIVAGIECGMHGHLGPNGSRGSPMNLSRLGLKSNVGHYHSAAIVDGLYAAGTSSCLRMDYNRGPSSWSHSLVVTYKNGKRAIITVWRGKWRA